MSELRICLFLKLFIMGFFNFDLVKGKHDHDERIETEEIGREVEKIVWANSLKLMISKALKTTKKEEAQDETQDQTQV